MPRTSIGFHTATMFRRFDHKDIALILKDIKAFSKTTGGIMIYPTDETKRCYRVDYTDPHSGIDYWQIRFCSNPTRDFKQYIVEAKINPKILAGETDYVRAANESYLPRVAARFDEEAEKLSKRLGWFYQYRPNRVDYCVNFDLLELGFPVTPEQMMELIGRSNIPAHYSEYQEYHPKDHRMKSLPDQFYLISNSVVINSYGKYAYFRDNHPDNQSMEDSRHVIRLEVQCKYMKLYAMTADLKRRGASDSEITRYLFSDHVARAVVISFFDRVIMRGDYYTLRDATEKVIARNFRDSKRERLIGTLNLISQQRSIHGAKETLTQEGGDLPGFNQALHELVDANINPVTVPKSFGIKHIPNLLEAFFLLEQTGQTALERLADYTKACKKHKKKRKR